MLFRHLGDIDRVGKGGEENRGGKEYEKSNFHGGTVQLFLPEKRGLYVPGQHGERIQD
jgi:hypothetical protein